GALGARDDDRGEASEGRQAGIAAGFDLTRVERLAVARDDCRDYRVGWVVGLDEGAAGAARASGAPGHLAEQLERALGGAHVAEGEAEIAVDYADQGKEGKVVALGDELGADDDVHLAFGDRGEFAPQPIDAARKVARHDNRPRLGKAQSDLFGQAL